MPEKTAPKGKPTRGMMETTLRVYVACFAVAFGLAPTMGYSQLDSSGGGYSHTKEFPVEGGILVVSNMQIFPAGFSGVRVTADVINKTDKNFASVSFDLKLNDRNGRVLGTATISVGDLNVGATKPFGRTADGERLVLNQNGTVAQQALTFRSATPTTKFVFLMIKPQQNSELKYSDNLIDIAFTITATNLAFQLSNKTDNVLKIDWNNVAYVDTQSESHKTMSKGTKYVDKEKPQLPTIIPPGAKIQDRIHPVDYVEYLSSLRMWSENPLFIRGAGAQGYKGKIIGVFLPVDMNGSVKNYYFSFRIEDVLLGQ